MGPRTPKAARPLERLSGIQDARDRQQVVEVFCRAFADPTWMERHLEKALFRGPIYRPEHTRLVVADGRVVSAVTMAPRMIRFGPVSVPAMTVGPVGTHDHYRKRGYSAAAMNDASRYMAENGYLVAYLQGIPNYYYRFGYYPYMAPTTAKFDREEARKESAPGRLRAMTRRELPLVRRLYSRATRRRICAADRDEAVWDWLMGPGGRTWLFKKPRVILDDKGRICGYVTAGQSHGASVAEIVVRQDEASCRAALGALVRDARRREQKQIQLPIPWDDALAVFLRQHVPTQWTMHSGSTGGALLKIVDFPALMRRLEPTFSERWRESRAALGPARFRLKCELGEVGFDVAAGRVQVGEPGEGPLVRIPQRWLSGVLTGYHPVRDIARKSGASVPAELLPAMEVLFPTAWPFVYQGDNY